MENTDDLKGKSFDSINSILANSLDSNALLSTCLDVLIAVHNDGKTEEEKAAYFKKINEKLAEHRKEANLNLIPVKK
ncbi:MAG: hypothetical protein HOP08_17390 [Cyclobacteriaceae bacterium]|nr:hypothetical protein [Cyclobacteriaceae bacterium]